MDSDGGAVTVSVCTQVHNRRTVENRWSHRPLCFNSEGHKPKHKYTNMIKELIIKGGVLTGVGVRRETGGESNQSALHVYEIIKERT